MLYMRSDVQTEANVVNRKEIMRPFPRLSWRPLCLLLCCLFLLAGARIATAANPVEMIAIPGGGFQMGDHHDIYGTGPINIYGTLPLHPVTLDTFYMGKYEVTNQQYCDFLNDAYPAMLKIEGNIVYGLNDVGNSFPYYSLFFDEFGGSQIEFSGGVFTPKLKGDTLIDMSNHPVIYVTWYGSAAYCNWLSGQEGLESCFNLSTWQCDFTKGGYRLPTEAQWEYAARGGEYSPYYRYPWGDTIDNSMANDWLSMDPYEPDPNFPLIYFPEPYTSPVGYYDGSQIPAGTDMANGYGLYDMAGNAAELVYDKWNKFYYNGSLNSGTVHNPTGADVGPGRIIRSGSYKGTSIFLMVSDRNGFEWPETSYADHVGFRVAASLNTYITEPQTTSTPPGLQSENLHTIPGCCCSTCPKEGSTEKIGHSIYGFSGEYYESAVDLQIKGRGLDFTWGRKYRSQTGLNTAQGNGWDFSYNICLQQDSNDIVLFDGNTRSDRYLLQADGTWAGDGFFRELTQDNPIDPDTDFTMTFSDKGSWHFNSFSHPIAPGKISAITDRNGNTLHFDYDGQGRLVTIHDTLDTALHNRDITISYNGDSYIESVTDFLGRQVKYEYYQDGDVDGSAGDLKSVTSPAVTGTPTGNDFPDGKTTIYTYSKGFADESLNHNLLTITDPKGQTYLINEYYDTQIPADLRYDRIKHQTWGDPSDITNITYAPETPSSQNCFAILRMILNDRMGNVSEHFYDQYNHEVLLREYTGRANPGQLTTVTDNRPTGKLRPGDPDFYETKYKWNEDSRLTEIIHPNGNSTITVYELDLDPSAPRRARGNIREIQRLPGPLGGDQSQITESFEYDDDLGCGCGGGTSFVSRHIDGRGNETLHTYDDRGNRTHTQHRFPSIVEDFEYNEFGQMTKHILPDNGNNHRRVDLYTYYSDTSIANVNSEDCVDMLDFVILSGFWSFVGNSIADIAPPGGDAVVDTLDLYEFVANWLDCLVSANPQTGYLKNTIIDAANFAITTSYEYDPVGNIIRRIDPRGNDSQTTYNQLDQIVRTLTREISDGNGVRYESLTFYDFNDNVVRTDIQNKDDQGTLQANSHFTSVNEYDTLNYLRRSCTEVGDYTGVLPGTVNLPICTGLPDYDFITTEYEYDKNRNQVLVRSGEATESRQPDNVAQSLYDERDLLFQTIRAPGSTDQSTDQYDYDGNRNVIRMHQGLEDTPRMTQYTYDGYNRETQSDDPMGNRIESHYDENSNVISERLEGELVDIAGDTGNVRLNEVSYEYDLMDRQTKTSTELFDTETQAPILAGLPTPDDKVTTAIQHSDTSQVISATNDNNHTTTFTYDTVNRKSVVTDAKDNTTSYFYDQNSNVAAITEVDKSDLGSPDETFTTTYNYDDHDRLVKTIDNVGNTQVYTYDSRDNRTSVIDALNNEIRYIYDGLNRNTHTTHDLDGDGADGDGDDITTSQVFDDNSRRISQADDNGNTTTYTYDALNRRRITTYADGTQYSVTHDVHDNPLTSIDGNGNVTTSTYDLLNRLTNKTISVSEVIEVPDGDFEAPLSGTWDYLSDPDYNGPWITPNIDSAWVGIQQYYAGMPAAGGQALFTDSSPVYQSLPEVYQAGTIYILSVDVAGTGNAGWDDSNWELYFYHGLTANEPDRVVSANGTDAIDGTYTTKSVQIDPAAHGLLGQTISIGVGGSLTDFGTVFNDMTLKALAPGSSTTFEDYAYDGQSRLVTAEDDDSLVTRSYDSLSRVTRETLNGQTISCVFDGEGNQTQCIYPGGRTISTIFDNLERKKVISDSGGIIAAYDYVGGDRVARRDYGNSTRTDFTYDGITGVPNPPGDHGVRRIIGTIHSKIAGGAIIDDHTFTWDKMYNKTQRKDVRAGGPQLTHEYTYDDIYRLKQTVVKDSVSAVVSNTQYDLDSAGNRINVVGGANPGTYVMDATTPSPADSQMNQYTSTPVDTRMNDENGNLVTIDDILPTQRDIAYDYRNQMIQHSDPTGKITKFAYDALSRRIEKVVDAAGSPQTTRYFYDSWQVCEEQDAANSTLATYAYGLYIDEVLNMQRDGTDFFYHTDDLYSIMAITDDAGTVVERYEYTDYGQLIDPTTLAPIVGNPSAIGNAYMFTGRRHDPETGWYYYRTRYLDPVAGRFTTRDTLGIWGDIYSLGNGYAYGANNPINELDPMGQESFRLEYSGPKPPSDMYDCEVEWDEPNPWHPVSFVSEKKEREHKYWKYESGTWNHGYPVYYIRSLNRHKMTRQEKERRITRGWEYCKRRYICCVRGRYGAGSRILPPGTGACSGTGWDWWWTGRTVTKTEERTGAEKVFYTPWVLTNPWAGEDPRVIPPGTDYSAGWGWNVPASGHDGEGLMWPETMPMSAAQIKPR